jgi:hypothetical protein
MSIQATNTFHTKPGRANYRTKFRGILATLDFC